MIPTFFSAQEDLGYAVLIIAVVGLLHNISVAIWTTTQVGPLGALGNRDNVPPETGWAARARRAQNNFHENVLLFFALALAGLVFASEGDRAALGFGALVFAIMRAFYLPAYLLGVPVLRSLVWLASLAGLGVMVWGLFS